MLKDLNPPRRHSRHPSAGGEFISCFFCCVVGFVYSVSSARGIYILIFCGDGNNIGVMKMFGLFFTTTTTTPLGV